MRPSNMFDSGYSSSFSGTGLPSSDFPLSPAPGTAMSTFRILEQPSTIFEDGVDIRIDAYTGSSPAVLANFPYRLVLSERQPEGFTYVRAGTGEEIRHFTLSFYRNTGDRAFWE